MKREFYVLLVALFFLLSFQAFAQSRVSNDESPLPESQDPGSSLIAWTEMQEPQPLQQTPTQTPTPEPRPETAPPQQPMPSTQPEPKPAQPPSTAQPPEQDQHAQPATQTFTGMISKDGDTYVLKVSDAISYKLDDQDQAKQYEGQRVRVLGALESSSNLIRVQKIEPIT
jgi:outer membrane biosynthesis protein TonB